MFNVSWPLTSNSNRCIVRTQNFRKEFGKWRETALQTKQFQVKPEDDGKVLWNKFKKAVPEEQRRDVLIRAGVAGVNNYTLETMASAAVMSDRQVPPPKQHK